MPLLEETADLSRLSTGGKRDMSGRGAGTITTNTSVPASVSVTPDNVVAAIEAAQNTEINVTPQRKVLPETPLTPPKLPKTPPKPTPQLGQGVDFFGNDNVKGFVTNTYFQNTDHVSPLRPNIAPKDAKGDIRASQFTVNKKSTDAPAIAFKLNSITIPTYAGISNDQRSGFETIFNQNNLFSTKFNGSRLEDIGTNGFFDTYYSQVGGDSGLGMRSNNNAPARNLGFSGILNPKLKRTNAGVNLIRQYVLGDDPNSFSNLIPSFEVPSDKREPFIIRGIGQRWGIDRVSKPEFTGVMAGLVQIDKPAHKGEDAVKSFINAIDDVGGRIIGRQPSVFLDRYFADVRRINGATNSLDFLLKGSRFVQAQQSLQRQNPFNVITTTLYDLSDEGKISVGANDIVPKSIQNIAGADFVNSLGPDPLKLNLNPKAYNPLSVFSVPGVLGINRNSYVDLSNVINKGTLADFVSEQVYEQVEESAIRLGTYVGEQLLSYGKDLAQAAGKGLDQIGDSLSKIKFPSINIGAKKSKEKLINFKAPKINLPDISSPGLAKGFKTATSVLDGAQKTLKKAAEVVAGFGDIPSNENANVSKAALAKLSKNAFDEKGRDRVNLIPYGKDSYKNSAMDVPHDELDWIPFKFRDVRMINDKGGGNIIFRAILSGITDTFSPEYGSERYIGRPDSVYVYQGTSREISFTFDVYPKSDVEMITLWEKLNYLAGQTYPHWTGGDENGGLGMISPFTELTIGEMYTDAPGYISSLTYTVMDVGTWETNFAKLPKYIQVSCTFVYIGKRLPSALQKQFEASWIPEHKIGEQNAQFGEGAAFLGQGLGEFLETSRLSDGRLDSKQLKKLTDYIN